MKQIASVRCGDITALYLLDPGTKRLELQLVPTQMEAQRRKTKRREFLGGTVEIEGLPKRWTKGMAAVFPDSLVQFKALGDIYCGGFAGGLTMRHSESVERLAYSHQDIEKSREGVRVVTFLATPDKLQFEHELTWHKGESGVRIRTRCRNEGRKPVTLEMLSSFSIGGLTPFDEADALGRLVLHRYRSYWSMEGRLDSSPIEELHLERSWTGHSQHCERFGSVGSMPVRKFFPFAAIEDTKAGVIWAAQLAHPGSWQMEVYRRGDTLALGGGLADREFGHWMKTLKKGQELETPEAFVTVVQGDLEQACQRLTGLQIRAADAAPAVEQDLPIVFNEWCTSWGDPTHENLLELADRLQGTPTKYLVIDAGWTKRQTDNAQENGDWVVDRKKYPQGLAATCAAIRERGLIPGIWFEFEVATPGSKAFRQTAHQLKRDGMPLQVATRHYWDFRDPWVHDFMAKRVTALLRDNGFGYLKVDYNDTIGLGCDGAESLGEGLRQHLEGVQRFFRSLREALPDLVIENCSSGGHRLEPSMQGLCSMGSFSDAHETVEIPVIAAALHNLILPRQSQIWAVLRANDSLQRLHYLLAANFLGRMVLSGDIHQLSTKQWAVAQKAMALYREVAPIIRNGFSRRHGPLPFSFRHPKAWQAVVRDTGDAALVVVHTFGERGTRAVSVPLPAGKWRVAGHLAEGRPAYAIQGGELRVPVTKDFSGQVIRLVRQA